MNAKDQNRYRMIAAVRSVLGDHETDNTWTKIPALVTAVEELDAVFASIGEQHETTASPSGAAAGKTVVVKALLNSAHEVASAVDAFATASNNDELAAQVDISFTALAKGRESYIIARCSKILALATEHLADLGDYNITQAKLTALSKRIDAFQAAAPRPRQGAAKKSAANKSFPRLFQLSRTLLTRRIDRLMVQFKTSAPEFYAEFQTARKIVNQSGGQSLRTTANIVIAPVTLPQDKAA